MIHNGTNYKLVNCRFCKGLINNFYHTKYLLQEFNDKVNKINFSKSFDENSEYFFRSETEYFDINLDVITEKEAVNESMYYKKYTLKKYELVTK